MSDQTTKAKDFAALHNKGNPVIIYNIWDGGSAKAVAAAGAKAIATGDHPVGFAHGFDNDNFDDFSYETYLGTIKEIAKAVDDLPFSVDISNGDDLEADGLKARVTELMEIGVVGINFEDRLTDGGGVAAPEDHAERIATIRDAADQFGVPLFINARSDMFAVVDAGDHANIIDEAIDRATTYNAAGANGFFVPGLMDIELITQLCERSPLPINIIRLPGSPSAQELVNAGVSRISYGPVVHMQMSEWLKDKAANALELKD